MRNTNALIMRILNRKLSDYYQIKLKTNYNLCSNMLESKYFIQTKK